MYTSHIPKLVFVWLIILVCIAFPLSRTQAQSTQSTDKPILRIETGMHTTMIRRIGVDAANRYFVTASDDKTVRVWDAKTGALLSILRPPIGYGSEGKLYAVAISPDGRTVACGGFTDPAGHTQSLFLFDRATGTMQKRVTDITDSVFDLAYSPDGHFLVLGLAAGGIWLYRTTDYSLTAQDTDYADQCYGVAFGSVGNTLRLVTSCWDGFLRLYDVDKTNGALHLRAKRKETGGSQPYAVAFSPKEDKIAVGFEDTPKVSVVSGDDLSSLYRANTSDINDGNLHSLCWSVDGRFLYASGSYAPDDKRVVRQWAQSGKGEYTDIPVSGGTIFGLQPRQAGGLFFAAYDPAWGILDAKAHVKTLGSPAIADLRDNQEGFRVSADGRTVVFGYQLFGKSQAVFSLSDRKLTLEGAQANLTAPVMTADVLNVQNWKYAVTPTLNGQPLKLDAYEISRSLAISPDHARFLLGTEWALRLFGKDGTQIWQASAPGIAWDVNISGDGKVAVAAFGDGTIRWYRMADGQELCAFFPHADKKRWVLWTPSGYYDCSPGGEDLIGWHVNHGRTEAADFFPASRFRQTYYRPDVVAKVLTTQDEKEALRQANEEADRKVQVADIQKTLPPVVTIVSPSNGTAVAADKVTIKYSVRTPSGEPVTNLKILVDGRPISTSRKITLVSTETSTAHGVVKDETVPIPHQDCTVSLIAANQYTTSEAATVHLVWQGNTPTPFSIKPTLYVLAVGISKYDNPEFSLNYPAKDARDFVAALQKQNGQLYSDVQVKLLTDGDATKDKIADGLEWIERQTTQHDVAMVFLSGHGANDHNGNYLFIPSNFDQDHIKATGLSFSDIKETVQNLACKTLFFVDSCHSGNVMGTTKSRAVDITGAVNELSSAENGAVVFAASTGNQVALEDPGWGNGAFTKALIEAISGQADYNHDGTITVNMLDLYISKRVKDLTHGNQTPTTTKPETVPDFPVAIKK